MSAIGYVALASCAHCICCILYIGSMVKDWTVYEAFCHLGMMVELVNMQGGFPMQLTALRKLRELELTSVGPGAFVSLPNSISNWVELRDLQLYRCGFEKLPDSISALTKLDTLLMEGFRCVCAWQDKLASLL